MIIKVLSENTAVSTEFKSEHGLSLYIETGKHKVLFDTGASGIFLENAERLGVNIEEVDIAVISHGHSDHGGGLVPFLNRNSKAPVYMHPKAFGKYYYSNPDGIEFVGLEEKLRGNKRIIPTTDAFLIDQGLELLPDAYGHELLSLSNRKLMMEKEGFIVQDDFGHEQNLVITENGKAVLITGCAHNGIVNIVNKYFSVKKSYPDICIGGFHLSNPSTGKSEDETLIREIGERLNKTGSKYYTCHCTGTEGFRQLKDVMGDSIDYLAAGGILEI